MSLQTATNPSTGEKVVLIGNEWKPYTQSATNQQGMKAYLVGNSWMTDEGMPSARKTEKITDQIPGYDGPEPQPQKEYSWADKLRGAIEVVPAMVTGAVTAPLVEGAKIYGTLTSGKFGTQEGIKIGERTGERVAKEITYQPRTAAGQEYVRNIGEALSRTGLQGVPLPLLEQAGQVSRPAIRAAADLAKAEGAGALEVMGGPIRAMKEAELQGNIRRSYENAATIDAAKLAQKHGIAVNPVVSNPTPANKVKAAVYGTESMDPLFAKQNQTKWSDRVKKDIGVSPTTKLSDTTYNAALDDASKPFAAVSDVQMMPTDEIVTAINNVRIKPTIGGKSAVSAVNELVNDAQTLLSEGRTGAEVLQDIRKLRFNASNVYKSQKVGAPLDPSQLARADASIQLANVLEDLIDANVKDPSTLAKIRAARTRMAQIYDFERATDPISGLVDPQVFAKMLREGKPLTGTAAELGTIAGMFPGIAEVSPGSASLLPVVQRGGAAGAVGAAIGSLAGPWGAAGGGVLGATAGSVARPFMAKRLGTPEAQAKFAMPSDYRPPVNQLRPVEPVTSPNQPVPYDWTQSTTVPPNFVFAQPRVETLKAQPQVTPTMPPSNRLLGASSAEDTINALRAEDARRAGVSRAMGQEAEARAAAAEAAARRPTSGEVILDLDPITGKLREVSQGIKGATPETFSNFGSALETAADKVTSGKRFDLTAAEKVAWDRTKVDLSEVAPGFKALSDKAIAEKMMDRQWVAETAAKAREKASAFEQIADRAADERARQAALANRERMMDLAEQMETTLSKARPVAGKTQGPKTREAIRNRLRPTQQIENNLLQ